MTMKNKKQFLIFFLGLFAGSHAFARLMVLSNTNCKIYEYDRSQKHWNASTDTSSINQTVDTKTFKKNFYIWRKGSTQYSADATCFSAPRPRSRTAPAPTPAAAFSNPTQSVVEAKPAPAKRLPFLKAIHLGFLSWGETPTLQSSTQNYDLVYRTYTFMLGFSKQFYRTASTSLEGEIAIVHGSAEVNEKSGNTPSPINYVSKTSSVNGLQLSPGIYYNTNADLSENGIGLVVPILYRITSYDDPGAGYSITGKSKMDIGLAVVGRLDKDSFLIEPRYGFTQSFTNWYLAFALGKTF
jgi:hypothetical protein